MKYVRLLVALTLVFLISSTAFADPVTDVTAPGQVWTWSLTDWSTNGSTCQMDMSIDWHLQAVGPNSAFAMEGEKDSDPVVNQLVTNYSSLQWSDWHVQLINGTIRPGSVVVKKNGSTEPWSVTEGAVPGYDSGFTAIGWPPAELVGQYDALSISFTFDPIDVRQRVSIKQWPTTDFVPEPGSIVTLGMGLATLGFTLRRRVK